MIMCSRCHKRAAVIFLHNPQMGDKPEGFCVKCARELGIKPVDDIIAQSGLDDDTIERLNSDVQELIDNGEIKARLFPVSMTPLLNPVVPEV